MGATDATDAVGGAVGTGATGTVGSGAVIDATTGFPGVGGFGHPVAALGDADDEGSAATVDAIVTTVGALVAAFTTLALTSAGTEGAGVSRPRAKRTPPTPSKRTAATEGTTQPRGRFGGGGASSVAECDIRARVDEMGGMLIVLETGTPTEMSVWTSAARLKVSESSLADAKR